MRTLSRRTFLQLATATLALPGRAAEVPWQPLFDGKALGKWKPTEFSGGGEVTAADGRITLEAGNDLTGITYTGDVPRMGYEASLEATRLAGSDFFCGWTFPVGEEFVSFILGGWGGAVVGISSINDDNASENETTQFQKFETGKWYRVRVRVTPGLLEAWIDDEQMVKVATEGKRLAVRAGEIEASKPFGICSFRTRAALRNLQIRTV